MANRAFHTTRSACRMRREPFADLDRDLKHSSASPLQLGRAARPPTRLQSLHKHLELGVRNRHKMLVLRESAILDIGPELLEGGDALLLQTVIFGAKVAIDLRMARLMAARIAQDVLREQVLRIAA